MRNKNLENRLKGHNWAYTGSLAMKLHANRLGVNFPRNRRIGNINIAARDPMFLVPVIGSRGSGWVLLGSPEYRHTKFIKNSTKLNLFPANGRLAPKFIHVQKFNGYPPLMSINALLNQKRSINENNVFGNNVRKLKQNINFLKVLKNKNTKKTTSSSSPLINKPRSNRANNSTRKKLMF